VNQQPSPTSWADALSKAAWTLLLSAVVVFVAWQLLKQLIVPLVIIVALLGIIRVAVGAHRRDGW
jgi:CHASE2 domain-containing sensor protein